MSYEIVVGMYKVSILEDELIDLSEFDHGDFMEVVYILFISKYARTSDGNVIVNPWCGKNNYNAMVTTKTAKDECETRQFVHIQDARFSDVGRCVEFVGGGKVIMIAFYTLPGIEDYDDQDNWRCQYCGNLNKPDAVFCWDSEHARGCQASR